ncbi:MAG: nucleotidyltransferase family protein [Anaerolineales bacterium]
MSDIHIAVPKRKIAAFCRRWKVVEMGLFGSALRDDFNASSDVDVLVTFASDAQVSLFDLAQMQFELGRLFGRPVDVLEKDALRNPFRKREILKTARVIYAS